eukprot:11196394-Lingulodinium_polyedra.AAC.1
MELIDVKKTHPATRGNNCLALSTINARPTSTDLSCQKGPKEASWGPQTIGWPPIGRDWPKMNH